jgi:cysteine desulfurase / selenocysteine lyase
MSFAVQKIRADFPALDQQIKGKPLVYLDNAASSQVPRQVMEALGHFHGVDRSNIHRGVHTLSQRATTAYEAAREKIQHFIGAAVPEEVILTSGTTESLNLLAQGLGQSLQPGDEILISTMEHHSNIVPWQMVCERTGAKLVVIPINDAGELDMPAFRQLLSPRTRLLSVVWVSNALGTVNPVEEMIAEAHAQGIPVCLDAAQAAPHVAINVQDLDCDYLALSGHKIFGPNGVGVLWGKKELLEALPPYQGGGDMIERVSFEGTTYAGLPNKFEAGTPNIAGVIGLGAAVDYLGSMDFGAAIAHETELLTHCNERLAGIPGIRPVGTAQHKASVFSFVINGTHPHDIGTILDQNGIAIRTGHHCAEPVMKRLGVDATARASFAFYNTHDEVEALGQGLESVVRLFGLT